MVAMNYQIEQNNHFVVARIDSPQLTGPQVVELTVELAHRMRHDNAQIFVLDLKKVNYMDSACVGALVGFLQDLEHVRGRIALASCSPNVEFLFKVTRLDTVFKLYEAVEDARDELLKP